MKENAIIEIASEIQPPDEFTQPFRVVLHKGKNDTEIVVHIENLERAPQGGFKPKKRRDLYWGFYTSDFEAALDNYKTRCKKYNLGNNLSWEPFKYKAIFPVTDDMSPISYLVSDKEAETKEQEALWHYNKSRDHDGLPALCELPDGVIFKPIH